MKSVTFSALRRFFPVLKWRNQLCDVFRRAIFEEIDEKRLSLWVPVVMGSGVAFYFTLRSEPPVILPALGLFFSSLLFFAGRKHLFFRFSALFCCSFALGFLSASLKTRLVATTRLERSAYLALSGDVESLEKRAGGGRFILAIRKSDPAYPDIPERARLSYRGNVDLVAGERVSLKARLYPPYASSLPQGYDFSREAYFARLGAVGFVFGKITKTTEKNALKGMAKWNAIIDNARNNLAERIIRATPGPSGFIAASLVTGKRGEILEKDNENMRRAGIYHVISISGLHMFLVTGAVFWVARLFFVGGLIFFPSLPIKKMAAIIAMMAATAYCVFAGSDVATQRSLVMILIVFGAILCGRSFFSMRNLAISAVIILILFPETLLGPSFQMSFAAVAGLISYGEAMRRRSRVKKTAITGERSLARRWIGSLLNAIIVILATSFVTGAITAPFQARHFFVLTPLSFFGNLLALPVVELLGMPTAILAVVLSPFGWDTFFWRVFGVCVAFMREVSAFIATFPGTIMPVKAFDVRIFIVIVFGFCFLMLFRTRVFRLLSLPLFAGSFIAITQTPLPDIILGPYGKSLMMRDSMGNYTLLDKKTSSFVLRQWARSVGIASDTLSLKALRKNRRCDSESCSGIWFDGARVTLVFKAEKLDVACEEAAILVTRLHAPPECAAARVFDADDFARNGAARIYARAGFKLDVAKREGEDRPWTWRFPEKKFFWKKKPVKSAPKASRKASAQ